MVLVLFEILFQYGILIFFGFLIGLVIAILCKDIFFLGKGTHHLISFFEKRQNEKREKEAEFVKSGDREFSKWLGL